MNIRKRGILYVYRNAAGEGGNDGGAGAAAAGNNAGGAAGGAAGSGDNGAASGNQGASAGQNNGAAAGSVLQNAAQANAGDSGNFIPEKFQVKKEDGTLDLEASARKVAEAYGQAEKRIGSGDVPPKSAEEYAVTIPEAFKEAFDPKTDEGFKTFAAGALEKKFTQEQLDYVMQHYFTLAPQLTAGATMLDAQAATAELQKTWTTEADFKRNVTNAYSGAAAIAQKAGLDINEIMAADALGNNPMFLRLMAAIGPEFMEDSPPGGQQMGAQESIEELMTSEAYTNPRHKDHAKVTAKVKNYYEKKYGTQAAG